MIRLVSADEVKKIICKCGTDGFYINTEKGTPKENIKANAVIWNMRVD